jgi:hypothetical protein
MKTPCLIIDSIWALMRFFQSLSVPSFRITIPSYVAISNVLFLCNLQPGTMTDLDAATNILVGQRTALRPRIQPILPGALQF